MVQLQRVELNLSNCCMQVVGKQDDWFVYKVPRGCAAGEDASATVMSDTVNVGRHTITEVSGHLWCCCWNASSAPYN